jgi:flagellar biosynthesis protein FlhB
MDAPSGVCTGVGFLALKMRDASQEHDIPLVENKTLAPTLHKSIESGALIPSNLYKAGTSIMANVYKAPNAL